MIFSRTWKIFIYWTLYLWIVYIYWLCILQLIYIILTSHLILSLSIIFQLSIIIYKKFFLSSTQWAIPTLFNFILSNTPTKVYNPFQQTLYMKRENFYEKWIFWAWLQRYQLSWLNSFFYTFFRLSPL